MGGMDLSVLQNTGTSLLSSAELSSAVFISSIIGLSPTKASLSGELMKTTGVSKTSLADVVGYKEVSLID